MYEQISKPYCLQLSLKLICVDDKFSKPFKSYLVDDAAYNFIKISIEETNYSGEVKKKVF